MKGSKNGKTVKGIAISVGTGFMAIVIVCMIGALLIEKEVLTQELDAVVSGIGIAVGMLTGIMVGCHWTSLPKWTVILLNLGVMMAGMLVGNLCIQQPDLGLLGYNVVILASAALLSVVLVHRKKKPYRVKY